MPAITEPETDQPETVESDTETTTEGDTAEPLDLVGGLVAE